ncbi:MAG: vWA domain-containing protein, partial [bacterium]
MTVSSGGFTYNYLLNGITGTYTVKVMDGATLLASETFTDHTSSTLQINNNDAAVHTLSVTLTVAWTGSGGDPTQARFVNVTPTALGCPSPLDPSWSPWVATSPPSPDTFSWTMAAGDTGHRKVCAQTGHGPLGSPTPGETLTADDTIWYTVANPALADSCGLDMVLVLDSSGSINATELTQMKSAFNAFVAAFLPETPTEMAVVDFDTSAAVIQPFTSSEATLNTAINSVASGGATNWDDALFDARGLPHRPTKPDLMVFASDGNPNTRGGHIYPGHSPVTVAVTEQEAMDHATDEADEAKLDSIRILGLGIGSDLDVVNMKAITGNTSHPPSPISPSVDVITTDFSTLAADLAALAAELCG